MPVAGRVGDRKNYADGEGLAGRVQILIKGITR